MKHLGDICQICGLDIEPVDVVTGGSPCQDLSVAGGRAGLAGERSGLFREQIRVVREMRAATLGMRPRFMVWENVPGALNSNRGRDFMEVLHECIKTVEPEAPAVPVPKEGWPNAGCLYDELGGWSVAWRIHDARHWGTPQRRRRIALVCDFGGMCAPTVLFERAGVRGNPAQGAGTEKAPSGASAGCAAESVVYDARGNGDGKVAHALNCMHDPETVIICDRASYSQGVNAKYDPFIGYTEAAPTLTAQGPHAVSVPPRYRVRRLTPRECERLQGFPDDWTRPCETFVDSRGRTREITDTARYRAIGNSIALPFWKWLMAQIYDTAKSYEPEPLLGSLFDGIGGFPLSWPGRTAWASEIDEFCIAITRWHFRG